MSGDGGWFQVGAITQYDAGLRGPADPDPDLCLGGACDPQCAGYGRGVREAGVAAATGQTAGSDGSLTGGTVAGGTTSEEWRPRG